MFSNYSKTFNFSVTFILLSANAFNLEQSEILSFGKAVRTAKLEMLLKRTFFFSNNIFFPLYSLPNDKILDLTKFKAFADDKISLTQKLKFMWERVENIVGKGENAG